MLNNFCRDQHSLHYNFVIILQRWCLTNANILIFKIYCNFQKNKIKKKKRISTETYETNTNNYNKVQTRLRKVFFDIMDNKCCRRKTLKLKTAWFVCCIVSLQYFSCITASFTERKDLNCQEASRFWEAITLGAIRGQ